MKPVPVILECGHKRLVFHPGSKIRKHGLVFCATCQASKEVRRLSDVK